MLTYTNELVVAKLARALAYKEAKKDKSKVDFLINLFKKQIQNCIKATEHFTDRVSQRFEEVENDTLSVAISRAIRNTLPLQRGADYHIATTQKYLDEDSNIVVVLERQGEFGAVVAKYCHCDGCLTWNGVILNKFYNNKEKVDELFKNSNSLISLKTTINESEFHENSQHINIFKNSEEYFYLFKNGNWYVKNYKETNDEVELLDEILQETHFRKTFSMLRNKKADSLIGKELKSGKIKALKCQFATHNDEFDDDSKLLFNFKCNNQINKLLKLRHITSLEKDIKNITVFDDEAKNIYFKNKKDFINSNDEYIYKYLFTLKGSVQVIFNDKYASFMKNNEI